MVEEKLKRPTRIFLLRSCRTGAEELVRGSDSELAAAPNSSLGEVEAFQSASVGIGGSGGALPCSAQAVDKPEHLLIVGIEFETSFSHEYCIGNASGAEQDGHVAVNGFRTVGTKREGLLERKIGFAKDPCAFGFGFGQILRRDRRAAARRNAQTPAIDTRDGTAQLGEGLLGLTIAHEAPIASK